VLLRGFAGAEEKPTPARDKAGEAVEGKSAAFHRIIIGYFERK